MLTDNLVAYYKLDGNSNDSVGSNNLSNSNVTFTSGKINDAITLNGSSSTTLLTNYLGFNTSGNNNITISAWFYLSDLPSSGTYYNIFFLAIDPSSGTRYFYRNFISNTSGTYAIGGRASYNFTPSINTWYHLVVTSDTSQNNKTYLNGSLVASNTANDSASATNYPAFCIGNSYYAGSYFDRMNGKVDEVGIWSRALSVGEISTLYNGGAGLQYPFTTDKPSLFPFFNQYL